MLSHRNLLSSLFTAGLRKVQFPLQIPRQMAHSTFGYTIWLLGNDVVLGM